MTITDRLVAAVNALDHDSCRIDRMLAATDGRYTLDGTMDEAIYYEVVFR